MELPPPARARRAGAVRGQQPTAESASAAEPATCTASSAASACPARSGSAHRGRSACPAHRHGLQGQHAGLVGARARRGAPCAPCPGPGPTAGSTRPRRSRCRVAPHRRVAAEQHLLHHEAHREDVGAAIDVRARELLRRHVGRRAEHLAGAREPRVAVVEVGDAEVHHLGVPVLAHHDASGLRSRWITPAACAATSACATSIAIARARIARGARRRPVAARWGPTRIPTRSAGGRRFLERIRWRRRVSECGGRTRSRRSRSRSAGWFVIASGTTSTRPRDRGPRRVPATRCPCRRGRGRRESRRVDARAGAPVRLRRRRWTRLVPTRSRHGARERRGRGFEVRGVLFGRRFEEPARRVVRRQAQQAVRIESSPRAGVSAPTLRAREGRLFRGLVEERFPGALPADRRSSARSLQCGLVTGRRPRAPASATRAP